MPTPRSSEKKPEFIQRCIPELIKEGKTVDEAAAICYSIFTESKKMMITKTTNTKKVWDFFKLKKDDE